MKGTTCHTHRSEDNIVKMAILTKLSYRFNMMSSNTPTASFPPRIDKLNVKIHMKITRAQNNQNNHKKE